MEHGLPSAAADVDDHAIVLEPRLARGVGDEPKQRPRLVRIEIGDVAERVDVSLGNDEEVRRRLRRDIPDRDEAVSLPDVIAFAVEPAEEAVVRQRGSPPP